MSVFAIILLVVALVVGLAGCGGGSSNGVSEAPANATSHDSTDSTTEDRAQWTELNDNVWILTIKMDNGQTVTCVEDYMKDNTPVGITCDWNGFHLVGTTP